MSKNYTRLRGLHHLTSEEMYVLEWKIRNSKQTQPTLYTARFQQRDCFLSAVRPADFPAKVICCSEWQHQQNLAQLNCAVNLDESLAKGNTSPWAAWRCLNRLYTGVACSNIRDGSTSTVTQHVSMVRLLKPPCICYNNHYKHIPAL